MPYRHEWKLDSQRPSNLDAGQDHNSLYTLTIEMAKMLTITGPKVGAAGAYGARQNWNILLG